MEKHSSINISGLYIFLFFVGGGGGGRVDKSPRLSPVILIRKKELLLYLYYDFAVVWLFMFHAVPWVGLRSVIEMMECIRRLRYVLLYPALLQNRNFLVRVASLSHRKSASTN